MGTPYVIVNIADGTINWPKLSVSGSNRGNCLVTAKHDRDKHCAMCCRILRNNILIVDTHQHSIIQLRY